MSSLTVTLPKSLLQFVESQVQEGGYDSPGDYIQALLRQAENRQLKDHLEKLMLEGLNSGSPIEANAQFWEDIKREVEHGSKKAGKK